ncbi:Moderate conductance mechanosensitive channel YbiO precursor [Pseudovibrio sp. Ad13]|uniref:mechanosensitive ion channel family protein n=1 Tax=Pseudovibrio sp. Ad13 TaxID=989396 RepID=UPI0007AE531C|nr:mechanosensitive ion channel domain-containing protein [Pseudovibrio sp. Ad13]KZK80473.1 Moderate conductance mechanosensitive channel YbiO precursor [Pseudovibrio sp. Ad13]
MQIRKSKKVSSDSSKADRFLNFLISFLTLAVLVGMGLLLHISFVVAQTPETQNSVVADPMVDAQEMVVQSESIPMEGAPLVFGLSNGLELFSLENIDRSSQSLNAVLKDLGNFPRHVHNALERARPDTSVSWVWQIFALTLFAVTLGFVVELFADKLFAKRLLRFYRGMPESRAEKIGFLFSRSLVQVAAIFLHVIVTFGLILVISGNTESVRHAALIFASFYFFFRLLMVFTRNFLAVGNEHHRVVPLDDDVARSFLNAIILCGGVAFFLLAFGRWMSHLSLNANAQRILDLQSGLFLAVSAALICYIFRRPIGGWFSGEYASTERRRVWRRLFSQNWHLGALAYFLVAWLVFAHRLLLGLSYDSLLLLAPIMAIFASVLLYGILLLVIDKWLLPPINIDKLQDAFVEEIVQVEEQAGHSYNPEEVNAEARALAAEKEAARRPYRQLLDHGARLVTLMFGLAVIVEAWGINLFKQDGLFGNLVEVALIVFFGYMAYQAVHITIQRQIEISESDKSGQAKMGRLATLLPILRNFLLVSIVVLSGMVALSEIGVNIGPLFAGAGVVGLAVGFGAQTLIKDIFSGAFFLLDDAFRTGEYIYVTNNVEGTVERISIRSMQLRQSDGLLNTVPFGNLSFVKNSSRDWTMMKLAFRVTYDTDVDRMRELISLLGDKLLEDPELGPKFLEPLQSQGITALEDSAMIVRVKFTTRPGDQYVLRKAVFAGIREIFNREGITFAHREVKVRIDEGAAGGQTFSDSQKKAVGGAVLPVVEEDDQNGSPKA